jgi:Leucine-rich repeat (LRR) protein
MWWLLRYTVQASDLCQLPTGRGEAMSEGARRQLPDLTPLASNLTALSLAGNKFTRLPTCLAKLTALRTLDMNGKLVTFRELVLK